MQALTVRKFSEDEVAQLRAGCVAIDLQLASCLEGEAMVFAAHRPTSTVVVLHENPGGTMVHIFEGGTEWDRRQAGLGVVGKAIRNMEARGIKCHRI